MTDTNWWQSLKEGDILLWSIEEWRYKGVIANVDRMKQSILVEMEHRHTRADTFDEKWCGPEQTHEPMDDTIGFNMETLIDADYDWMHKKAADIRIRLTATVNGREFRIWGDGEGSRDMPGAGGGLMYMSADSPSLS